MSCLLDLIAALEALAPPDTAEDWDNVGLQLGDPQAPVSRVMLAVDATPAVAAQAAEGGCELLIVHHPLIFRPLTALTAANPVASVVLTLLRGGLALYAAHTNLDKSRPVGTAAALLAELGLMEGPAPAQVEPPAADLTWRLGRLETAMPLQALAQHVVQRLAVDAVHLVGDGQRPVQTVAVAPGVGDDAVEPATRAGADIIVTGELGHHDMLLAQDLGLAAIIAGHLATERPVLRPLQAHLVAAFADVEFLIANECPPDQIIIAEPEVLR